MQVQQLVQPLSTTNFAQLVQQQSLLLKLAAMGYADLQPTLDAITQWPQGKTSPSAPVGSPGLHQLLQMYLNQQQPQMPATSAAYGSECMTEPSVAATMLNNQALFGLTQQQQPGSPSYSSNSSASNLTAPLSPVAYSSLIDPSNVVMQQQQQQVQQHLVFNNNAVPAQSNYIADPNAAQNNLHQLLRMSAALPAASAGIPCNPNNYAAGVQYSAATGHYNAGLASLATLTSQASNASSLASSISSLGPLRQASLGSGSWCSSTSNILDINAIAAAAAAAAAAAEEEVVVCSSFCKQEISLALNAAVTALLQTMRSLQYNGENVSSHLSVRELFRI